MAVRQYIGARYVTKIYENSLDSSSAEWEAGVTYEPLTMVTYMNSSYLSKKDVPGTVGDPSANPSYWVLTGAYNGQILSLQSQIDTINNTTIPALQSTINDKIDDFHIRKFLFISDSYDTIDSGDGTTMSDICASYGNWNYEKISRGGYGFTGKFSNDQQWIDLLPAVADKDTFTDVVFYGGLNDMEATTAEISTAMDAIDVYIKANFPNVKRIYCGYSGWIHGNLTTRAKAKTAYEIYMSLIPTKDWYILNNLEFISRDPALFVGGLDNDHPAPGSLSVFSKALYECITTGTCDYDHSYNIAATLNTSYFTTNTAVTLKAHIHNGVCTLGLARGYHGLSQAIPTATITLLTTDSIKIPFATGGYLPFSLMTGNDGIQNYASVNQTAPDTLNLTTVVTYSDSGVMLSDLEFSFNL